ncbi:hypothetical protein [Roseibium sp.]|uniref:hypothetical protein n=1 Tax=Roseibium sp. TaxID=1936156 RepID=UPI003BB1BDEF
MHTPPGPLQQAEQIPVQEVRNQKFAGSRQTAATEPTRIKQRNAVLKRRAKYAILASMNVFLAELPVDFSTVNPSVQNVFRFLGCEATCKRALLIIAERIGLQLSPQIRGFDWPVFLPSKPAFGIGSRRKNKDNAK